LLLQRLADYIWKLCVTGRSHRSHHIVLLHPHHCRMPNAGCKHICCTRRNTRCSSEQRAAASHKTTNDEEAMFCGWHEGWIREVSLCDGRLLCSFFFPSCPVRGVLKPPRALQTVYHVGLIDALLNRLQSSCRLRTGIRPFVVLKQSNERREINSCRQTYYDFA